MIYNTKNELEARQAESYLKLLISQDKRVEVLSKQKSKTLPQNNYIHLILTAWGGNLGMTLEEMKVIVKRDLLPNLFVYKKKGKTFYKSFALLTTIEATKVIDKVRETADANGYYIPAPNEKHLMDNLRNEAERYKNYQDSLDEIEEDIEEF